MAYEIENVLDLKMEGILVAEIHHLDFADAHTLESSLHQAQINLTEASSQTEIRNAVTDKGYHSNGTLTELREHTTFHSYTPELELKTCLRLDR